MFSEFFTSKIENIRDTLMSKQNNEDPHSWDKTTTAKLSNFNPVTVTEVKKLISSSRK